MQTGVTTKYHFFPFQLEIRAIAALFRHEKYSGQLHNLSVYETESMVTVYFCVCCYRRLH